MSVICQRGISNFFKTSWYSIFAIFYRFLDDMFSFVAQFRVEHSLHETPLLEFIQTEEGEGGK